MAVTELEKKVLEEIERSHLSPRPYAYFLARRSTFWALAVLSVALGAVSAALAIFAVVDLQSTGGRGLDEMPLDDVLINLPFVWLGSIALFLASAFYSIRQTRRGYRFRATHIIGAALLASVLLGGTLYAVGAGEAVHTVLRNSSALYDHLTRSSESRRNDPAGGFLVGHVLRYDGGDTLTLLDFDGHTWTVEIDASTNILMEQLKAGEDIAIAGAAAGPATFRVRSIRDWD